MVRRVELYPVEVTIYTGVNARNALSSTLIWAKGHDPHLQVFIVITKLNIAIYKLFLEVHNLKYKHHIMSGGGGGT